MGMPKTQIEMESGLERAQLACSAGKRALKNEAGLMLPLGTAQAHHALYNLLIAVEEIAAHLAEKEWGK